MVAAQAIRPQADCVSLGSSTRSCPLTLHLCREQQPCRDLVVNCPAAAEPEPESPGVQSSPEVCVRSSFLAFRAGKSSRIPAPSRSPHRQRGVEASQFLQCSGQALTHPHSSTGTWGGVCPGFGAFVPIPQPAAGGMLGAHRSEARASRHLCVITDTRS